MLTSEKFSQRIKGAGFKGGSEMVWAKEKGKTFSLVTYRYSVSVLSEEIYPAYDIIYDICVRYAKEFWGGKEKGLMLMVEIILMLRHSKPREEIEKYIWEYCKLNPKNK